MRPLSARHVRSLRARSELALLHREIIGNKTGFCPHHPNSGASGSVSPVHIGRRVHEREPRIQGERLARPLERYPDVVVRVSARVRRGGSGGLFAIGIGSRALHCGSPRWLHHPALFGIAAVRHQWRDVFHDGERGSDRCCTGAWRRDGAGTISEDSYTAYARDHRGSGPGGNTAGVSVL